MQVDPDFSPDEPLYLRIKPEYFDGAHADLEQLSINHIRFPNFSVNRGKYSEPEEVLKPNWLNYGIASFLVRDIPERLAEDPSCEFKVEHLPVEEDNVRGIEANYAHSEVRVYKDGVLGRKPNKLARLQFRAILRNRIVVIRPPLIQ